MSYLLSVLLGVHEYISGNNRVFREHLGTMMFYCMNLQFPCTLKLSLRDSKQIVAIKTNSTDKNSLTRIVIVVSA